MNFSFLKRTPEQSFLLEENRRLKRELNSELRAGQKAEKQINELHEALTAAESRFQQASVENGSILRQHGETITALVTEHSRDMSMSEEKYNRAMATLKREHQIALRNLEMDREKEKDKLVGQLLVNQDHNQSWPEDKLKVRFRELERLMESVTSPHRKEFRISSNQQLGLHIDPTNLVGRVGSGKFHFVLKNAIWTILREQFFSAPFGFGALGPGEGQKELSNLYLKWRKLFDERAGTTSLNQDYFAIFHQDKLANKWRAATFQCIHAAVIASAANKSAPGSPLAKLNVNNVKSTVDRIVGYLSEVSKFSNSRVPSEVEIEIQQMAFSAGEIAMQFGMQPAHLRLLVPDCGKSVEIGEEFHDCENGDSDRGIVCRIDLVIVPGLQKIGDGRSDMREKRIITPCEIYSDEAH